MTCFPCFGFWKQYYKGKEKLANAVTEMGANGGHTLHSVRNAPKNSSEPQFDPHVQSDDIAQTFTYRELAAATKNFRDDYFIGQGGFGSVYQGKLITGQAVAVKKLDPTSHQGDREFLVEVLMLSLLRHPNLVNLIGYCAEGTQRLLVYEHMALGSLEFHLHGGSPDEEPLDWNTRMMIAAGAAKGLKYLHNEANPPVIYRDLKSANILLTNELFPKLSDFGLAKFGPSGDKSHVSTRVMGTFGYCAPEYMETGKLTLKSDIYSFGVLLLELITGRKAVDSERGLEKELVRWARPLLRDRSKYSVLVDPKLQGQISESSLAKVIQVTSMCLREEANTRPQIGNVMEALDYIVSRLHKPKQAPKLNKGGLENGDSTKEASLMRNQDRAQAVAEAKLWGETFRVKQREESISDTGVLYRFSGSIKTGLAFEGSNIII